MQTIRQLLNRIRWDPRFRSGRFEIGYYDRRARQILTVPFADIAFPRDRPDMFVCYGEDGEQHQIPLHRVRRVLRDGRVIWQRRPPGEPSAD